MREIKFRAWDTYNNKMIPEKGGFYLGSVACEMMGGDDYPLMQYTGLKDKNDEEIYEGDIVQFAADILDDGEYGNILKDNYFVLAKVIYKNSAYRYDWGLETPMAHSACEIIGNIYENPKLLKED